MLKNISKLGQTLKKAQQQAINGGICKCRIKVPGGGRTAEISGDRCCGYPRCPPC